MNCSPARQRSRPTSMLPSWGRRRPR